MVKISECYINGKLYHSSGIEDLRSKEAAEKQARKWRKLGYLVSVRAYRNDKGEKRWMLWERKK